AVDQLRQAALVDLQQGNRRVAKQIPISLLAVPQRRLGFLARRDVHQRTYGLPIARFIGRGMGYPVKVLGRSVWHQQAMLKVKLVSLADGTVDLLTNESNVVGVHTIEHHLQRRLGRRIVFEDAKAFLGPEDLSARDVPAEAARVTQLLRLGQ